MKRLLLFLLLFLSTVSYAQTDPLAYLRSQCPELTALYQQELQNCHAHYIMAVDVSLSMSKYENDVLPALKSFIKALPDGDRVTLIPFAKNAYDNRMGFDVAINEEARNSLLQIMGSLYPHGQERREAQYFDTDIFEVQQSVVKSVQQNAQYDVNIIIFISDMMHCPANNVDRQFNGEEINKMSTLLNAAKTNAENRVFTLALPKSGNPVGFVLPKLSDLYAEHWDTKLESVDVPQNSQALIGQWFNRQKDRIMFTKLQALIIKENKANAMSVKTDVSIDGKVTADIHWKGGKLYPEIQIDSTEFSKGSSFIFKTNKEYKNYRASNELNEDKMDLGRILHRQLFFHRLSDTLYFNASLPVEYQDEINRLLEGRPSPNPSVKEYKEDWVWTFFLPLWMTLLILALILAYIILVIGAIKRNSKESFSGSIEVYKGRNFIYENDSIRKKSIVNIPGDLNSRGTASVEWNLTLKKKPSNIFLFWKKPTYDLVAQTGVIQDGSSARKVKRGMTPSFLRNRTIYCGIDSDHVDAYSVEIRKR